MNTDIITIPRELLILEGMVKGLAEVVDIDAAMSMRDTSERMVHWAKRRDYEASIINMAAEAKIRTERRLGELLNETPRRPAGRPSKNRSDDSTDSPPTLEELGISKDDSSNWQRVASIPAEAFEQKIAAVKQADKHLSTATMIGLYRELNKPEPQPLPDRPDFPREAREIERWLMQRREAWPERHREGFADLVVGIIDRIRGVRD